MRRVMPRISSLGINLFLLSALLVSTQASAVDVLVSNFTDTPDPAVRGGTIVYTASITNNTTDTANNVALALNLDAQTSFVSVSDPACSYAAGPHRVTCSYATLAGDISGPGSAQVRTINLTVRILAGAGATVDNTATVTTTDADVNPANDTLAQTTTVDNGADLALTLVASPLTAPASSLITYTASLSNNGPNVSGLVTSTFTLSPHLTYQAASGTGWSCGAAAQVVTCTRAGGALGNLPSITITAQATGAFTGTLTSTGLVAISGSAIDYNNSNDASTADVQITTGTDLAITKTASAAVVGGGQAMSFTLLPRNLGPFAASNVSVSDTLPAGFTNISASGTGWSCGVVAQTVTCTSASYAIGASNNITINATAPAVASSTTFTNTTSISSATSDGVSANNSGSVNFDVLPDGVDLSLTKTKGPNPVAQGANINSTIIVTNHGPRAAASGEVRVTETLSVGETYVGIASGTNWTCGAQIGQVVTCTYNAALAVGANASNLVLITTAVNIGTLSNTACTNYVGGVTDPTPANNCASASTTATASGTAIDLGIVKTVDLPVLAWNAPTVTYTITVSNAGPGTATGVIMSDVIPGYITGSTVVNAAKIGGTSAATFNCTNAETVACSQTGGSIAPGETVIFSIAVSRPLFDSSAQPGNLWTNTATVRSQTIGDANLANNSSSVTVQVDPVADVTVVNTVTPTTTLAGTQATYVLTVSNNGPSTAQNVNLTDVFTIPAGTMTFISATPSIGTCGAYNTGTRTFSCSLGAMASGSTATVTVVVRPDYMVAPPSPRTISNTATVSTTTQESNAGNNSDTSVLAVTLASLDLLINNTDNLDPLGYTPTPVGMDNIVTYRNTITNRGPSVASGLVLSYTMRPPAGKSITFLGDKLLSTGQVYANYCNNLNTQVTGPATLTVTCTFPPSQILAANNATTDLYLDYRVDTQPNANGDAYSSTAVIAANEPETVSANNTVNQTTTIKMRSDLVVTKTARAFIGGSDAATSEVQIRQPFYWVITVTNNGPGNSQVTTVTDALPANIALYTGGTVAPYNAAPYNAGVRWTTDNGTPTNGTCSGSTTLTCNIGILENGKVATIRVPVISTTVGSPATRQNCVSAVTSEVDPNAANNTNICSTVTVQRSSIDGTVYVDANNNAAKGAGEVGIAGVTMRLDGVDAYGNTITNLTTTTDSVGYYIFANRAPGTYTVTEVQPATYIDGRETAGTAGGTATGATGDAISNIVLPANTLATGYLFGELQPASLSGFVFTDLNNDAQRNLTGVPATDESSGITGINISLTGTDDLGPVNLSTNTVANGAYSFSNLRPGTYQVQQSAIPGLTHTGMTVGSRGGNDGASVVAADTPVIGAAKRTVSNIVLGNNDQGSNYNFGESGQALSGFVYLDLNNNGVKDGGEPGLAGVSVTLSGNTASNVNVCVAISPNPCTIVTDTNGAYNFISLPASAGAGYTLTEQAQGTSPLNNYADGTDSLGTVNSVTTGTAANDSLSGIVIALGQVGVNYNFGELTSSLSGKVYLDVDQNNGLNAGDTDLAGVTVTLSGLSASGANVCTLIASCTATTDASGNFSFTGLPASNGAGYSLVETQPVDFAEASNTLGTGATQAGTASVVTGNSQFAGIVLNAGQSGITYLFGEKTGSLSGFAYQDNNNNGNKDGGESGIAGVTITLTGQAASGGFACGVAVCTTTTAGDGSYTFSNLRNANGAGYTVTETQPAGYVDGITRKGTIASVSCAACVDSVANVISAIPFNAANSHANFNFGEISNGSIAGTVYFDANSNGVRDGGEIGIAGVPIALTGTATRNTVTDASGNFSFTALQAGTYTLSETQPSGYIDGVDLAGTSGGTVNAPKNAISNITLAAGANATDNLFGEKPTELARDGTIAGKVYGDTNKNASYNVGEPLLKDVSINLSGVDFENKVINRTEKTDAKGEYIFRDVPPGTYTLTEIQPIGWNDFADGTGSKIGTLAGGTVAMNSITGLVMPMSGGNATGYDFRETKTPATAVNGTIAGKVYGDTNKNASHNDGEPLLKDVSINLSGVDFENKVINRTEKTDANGAYIFRDVPPGTYTLSEIQPTGWSDFVAGTGSKIGTLVGGTAALNSISGLQMPMSGGNATGYDFRETKTPASAVNGTIAGKVYGDTNKNASYNDGEPLLKDVSINLIGVDFENKIINRTEKTDANGAYIFRDVPPGTYTLNEIQPIGWSDFVAGTGSKIGTLVGGTVAMNSISGLQMPMTGGNAVGYDFREFKTPVIEPTPNSSIAGLVYLQKTNQQDGKTPLAGITLKLTGIDSDGKAIAERSTVTKADGSYLFSDLFAGTYTVQEVQPQQWGDFPTNSGSMLGSVGGKLDSAANKMSDIVLPANTAAVNYDFREKPASIAGVVYRDLNHNGQQNTEEAGIANVTVILLDVNGEVARSSSAADGSFSFNNLPAGTYRLQEVPPAGYLDGMESAGQINGVQVGTSDNTGFDASAAKNSILGIALPAGQDGTQYLFGERLYQLSGFVYFDDNHNASKDANEKGIAGIRVTISGTPDDGSDLCQQINCVTRSANDGSFSFTQLPPGNYRLVETQSDVDVGKIIDGKETAGTAGGTVMNASFGGQVLQNTINAITLNSTTAPDGVASGYLFGERVRSGPTLKPPIVSGYVWFDKGHTRVRPTDVQHEGAAGWSVTLTQNGKFICGVTTDSNGFYQFDNLHCAGYEESGLPSGTGFDIKFSKNGNTLPNVATSGGNAGTVSGGSIRNLTLNPGDDITEQNLPLDPAGVVYDSVTRLPVAGAVVTISGPAGFDPAQHLLGGVLAEKQTTGDDGYYQFLLQNNYPSGTYHVTITSYPSNYIAEPSSNIPVCQGVLNVGAQPDPALVQKSNSAPALTVTKHAPNACVGLVPQGALDTQYYTSFNITPTSAPLLNNHLPLDPFVPGSFSLSKTGDKQQVEIGETVGYSIVVKQTSGSKIAQITVRDSLPAGFSLVPGTVRVNGKAITEPAPSSVLAFNVGGLSAGQSLTLTYRVRVGVGSMQGDGINRAIAYACALPSCVNSKLQPQPSSAPSNEGQFKVKVLAGVFTNDACVAGKVFVDCNNNHIQDAEELGIPGVRLYLEDGTHFISDIEGKYSYCGLSPKSHVMKVDTASLPRRSILTTTSNRNLGDANSLWLDVKNGELIRADFAEGSCSNVVLEQVKARRSQGGVRSVETETPPLPGLQFKSKAPNAPRQATDSGNQKLPQARQDGVQP